MLPLGTRLALSVPWWSWKRAVVRKALWASVLTRLRRLGNERLKANGVAGRLPSEWRHLDYLRKEPRTGQRALTGETNLCLELLLGYAGAIGLNTADCFPDTRTWVAEAAVYLAEFARQRVRPIGIAESIAYAGHVLRVVGGGPTTDVCVKSEVDRLPVEARAAVLSVAEALGPILLAHDPDGGGR
jgi:hypothetical protein